MKFAYSTPLRSFSIVTRTRSAGKCFNWNTYSGNDCLSDEIPSDRGINPFLLSLKIKRKFWLCTDFQTQTLITKGLISLIKYVHSSTLNVYIEIVHKASVQKMNTQSQEDKDNMAPLFVWVIRDFTLKSDLDGHSVTADEYLENCLKNVLRTFLTCGSTLWHLFSIMQNYFTYYLYT